MAEIEIPRSVVRGMVALSVLAVAVVVLMLTETEPNLGMWVFAVVMVLAAVGFWAAYFYQRAKNRRGE
ncbi:MULTISPECIES: hypothetical protein [Prauserella salsuginis group]|uniref:Uncharacterized protein n=2 Tax=Prauserella salsuginis group TaxID=2893672 RepID=A0A839XQ91_9PSEU|nr:MULTISPECIES: hypothetical protein [Prauserella salsuginis group]MBB3664867.1 hypothetical protein [Prauserella sediminis]MCR3718337.1 hypothetical protein [Prauserella flava]MCR3732907.1 hypothetical protein [Prauserella salsuginis]